MTNDAEKRAGIFDVISGTCGHTWLAKDSGLDYCPVCAEVDRKVNAMRKSLKTETYEQIRAQVEVLFRSIAPPYLFTSGETEVLPGMERTTVNDAIRDVWRVAHDEVLNLLDGETRG